MPALRATSLRHSRPVPLRFPEQEPLGEHLGQSKRHVVPTPHEAEHAAKAAEHDAKTAEHAARDAERRARERERSARARIEVLERELKKKRKK